MSISSPKEKICFLIFIIFAFLIHLQCKEKNGPISISKRFSLYKLDILINEHADKTGLYLHIQGVFENSDSSHEYVFYSQPFGLGPQAGIRPMKKLVVGKNEISKTADFYYCLSMADTLFNSLQSFDMEKADLIILSVADSLLNKKNTYQRRYKKNYQPLLDYKKLHFSITDEGLFAPFK